MYTVNFVLFLWVFIFAVLNLLNLFLFLWVCFSCGRLDVYIHDYLLKRKLHASAKAFMTEGKVATDPVGKFSKLNSFPKLFFFLYIFVLFYVNVLSHVSC